MPDVRAPEANIIVLERAALAVALMSGRQAAQPIGLDHGVDRIVIEMRQDIRDHKREIIEREACSRAQTMASSSLVLSRSACAAGRTDPGSPQPRAWAICE